MKVSIVVPTFNRKEKLRKTISSLKALSYPKKDYEIIIVDDGSNDGTCDMIKKIKDLRYFFQKNKGPAAARNKGIKNAEGEFIFFIDDDCIAPKNWIKTFLNEYTKSSIAGVGGPMIISPELKNNYYSYFMELKNDFPKKRAEGGMEIYGVGATCNMSYQKNILDKVGGFDESFPVPAGEDADLKKRIVDLGYTTVFVPLPVKHSHKSSLSQIVKMSINRGIGHYTFCRKHKQSLGMLVYIHIVSTIIFPLIPLGIILTAAAALRDIKYRIEYLLLEILSKYLFSLGVIKGFFLIKRFSK